MQDPLWLHRGSGYAAEHVAAEALHYAALVPRPEVVQLLLEAAVVALSQQNQAVPSRLSPVLWIKMVERHFTRPSQRCPLLLLHVLG